eukprot:247397-Chlamydomonas_euryale.AAC.5
MLTASKANALCCVGHAAANLPGKREERQWVQTGSVGLNSLKRHRGLVGPPHKGIQALMPDFLTTALLVICVLCRHACVYVCNHAYKTVSMHAYMRASMRACMRPCVLVWMYDSIHASMCADMRAGMRP